MKTTVVRKKVEQRKGVVNTEDVYKRQYYPKFDAEKPGFVRPWTDHKKHGKILLSGERGDRDLTDIMVFDQLPESIFTDFKRPDLSQYATK